MAAGLAATAVSATAQDQTQVYSFSGNALFDHVNDLSPNFDAGAGIMNVNFHNSHFSSSSTASRRYGKAELSINSFHFSALAHANLHRSTTGTPTSTSTHATSTTPVTSTHVSTNPVTSTHFTSAVVHTHQDWHETADAKAGAFSSSANVSSGSYIAPAESWDVSITFSDPNINGGAPTSGSLLVTSSATASNGSVRASVSLVSLTYDLTDYYWLQSVKSELNSLLSSNNSKTTNKQIDSAITDIDKALGSGNWQSGDKALGARASSFFTGAEGAIKTLETLVNAKGVSSQIISQANSGITVIVSASIQLAQQAYAAASDAHGKSTDLAKAQSALAAANSATGSTAVKDAAEAYKFSIAAQKLPK